MGGQAPVRSGQRHRAREQARAFVKLYPRSPYLENLEAALR
jgi:hypothetical protein